MKKVYAVLVAGLLLVLLRIQSVDGGDMICTKRVCTGGRCKDHPCKVACARSHKSAWGECLRRYPKCCECSWSCG